jgi:hypothetical protein
MKSVQIILFLLLILLLLIFIFINKKNKTEFYLKLNENIGWCMLEDKTININRTPYVFSFSLFNNNPDMMTKIKEDMVNNKSEISKINKDGVDRDLIIEWYNRYPNTQYNKFIDFLNNKNWNDYNIIHFISKECSLLPAIKFDNYKNNFVYDIDNTISNMFLEINKIFPNRYKQYIYECPDFLKSIEYEFWNNEKKIVYKSKIVTPYFGTLVRFLPLIMPNIDVVVFRDAHTTMPNPNYNYDVEWKNFWINNTNKKFWMYHWLNYNPVHADYKHAPFAATWAARKLNFSNTTIMTNEEWNLTFGDIKKIDNNVWEYQEKYGIDERLFYKSINNYIDSENKKSFIENTYLVGFLTMDSIFSLNNLLYENKTYLVQNSNKCNIINFIKEYSDMINRNPLDLTINEFFNLIESLQKLNKLKESSSVDDIFHNIITKQIYTIPTRWHIWNYLFDLYPFNPNEISMLQFLEYHSSNENLLDYCDLFNRILVGNEFNTPSLFFRDFNNNRKKLPDINKLPSNHPLFNKKL